jgi:hypothetical protein
MSRAVDREVERSQTPEIVVRATTRARHDPGRSLIDDGQKPATMRTPLDDLQAAGVLQERREYGSGVRGEYTTARCDDLRAFGFDLRVGHDGAPNAQDQRPAGRRVRWIASLGASSDPGPA